MDAATAQFPIIRLLLAHAAMHKRRLASVDIRSAFLHALGFTREVYVKPPPGWKSSPDIYWKLLKPAYGLFNAPLLWKLAINEWLFELGLCVIPILPKLF